MFFNIQDSSKSCGKTCIGFSPLFLKLWKWFNLKFPIDLKIFEVLLACLFLTWLVCVMIGILDFTCFTLMDRGQYSSSQGAFSGRDLLGESGRIYSDHVGMGRSHQVFLLKFIWCWLFDHRSSLIYFSLYQNDWTFACSVVAQTPVWSWWSGKANLKLIIHFCWSTENIISLSCAICTALILPAAAAAAAFTCSEACRGSKAELGWFFFWWKH